MRTSRPPLLLLFSVLAMNTACPDGEEVPDSGEPAHCALSSEPDNFCEGAMICCTVALGTPFCATNDECMRIRNSTDSGQVDSGDAGAPDSGDEDAGPTDVMIVEAEQFASGVSPCGLGFDHIAARIWLIPCSSTTINSYLTDGTLDTMIPIAGETPNDVDIDIAPEAFSLTTTVVPEGALLFINGETGVAEIYELDKAGTGTTATLTTEFGASHVVGGAFHSATDTFFLVQDRQVAGEAGNRVEEVDPVTGLILGGFQTTPQFSVNFGDLDVCQSTGNLFVVSSDESTIAEFDVLGNLIDAYSLPAGVSGAAGIDFDDLTGNAWVSGTNGTVWRLSGLPCPPR